MLFRRKGMRFDWIYYCSLFVFTVVSFLSIIIDNCVKRPIYFIVKGLRHARTTRIWRKND